METYCLNFALKYQILTPFTSFICVMKQNPLQPNLFFQPNKIVIPSIESVDYQVNQNQDKSSQNLCRKRISFGAAPQQNLSSAPTKKKHAALSQKKDFDSGEFLAKSKTAERNCDLFDNFSFPAGKQSNSIQTSHKFQVHPQLHAKPQQQAQAKDFLQTTLY